MSIETIDLTGMTELQIRTTRLDARARNKRAGRDTVAQIKKYKERVTMHLYVKPPKPPKKARPGTYVMADKPRKPRSDAGIVRGRNQRIAEVADRKTYNKAVETMLKMMEEGMTRDEIKEKIVSM